MRLNKKALSAAITLSLVLGAYGVAGAEYGVYGAGTDSAKGYQYLKEDGTEASSESEAAVIAGTVGGTQTYVTIDNFPGGCTPATTNSNFTVTSGSWAQVYGGYSGSNQKVHDNKVTINESAKISQYVNGGFIKVYSGISYTEDVYSNTVEINNGVVGLNVNAGDNEGTGDAYNNTLNVNGGEINVNARGGYAERSGNAYKNTVTITQGTVDGDVYGGLSGSGQAYGNIVNISGGSVGGTVYGGFSYIGAATGNTVNISGGTIGGNVYGGYVYSGSGAATSNTVKISGTADLTKAALYGYNTSGTHSDNTLTIDKNWTGGNNTVKSIQNFDAVTNNGTLILAEQSTNIGELKSTGTLGFKAVGNEADSANISGKLNFYIPATAKDGDIMLTVNGTVDLDGATVKAGVEKGSSLVSGNKINLIAANSIASTYIGGLEEEQIYQSFNLSLSVESNKLVANFSSVDSEIEVKQNGSANVKEDVKDKKFKGEDPSTYKVNTSSENLLKSENNKLEGVTLEVQTSGATLEDKVQKNDDAFANLAGSKPAYSGTNAVIKTNEGAIVGEAALNYDSNSKFTVQEKPNKHNLSVDGSLADSVSFGRMEMNDIRKRLGDVRINNAKNGLWARYENGKNEGSGLDQKFNKFQIGGDTAQSDTWRLGGAISYTKGSSDYAVGSTDTRTLSGAVYGVMTGKKGEYLDIIARVGVDKHDINAQLAKGDLNNVSYAVSAEVGKTYDFAKNYFVEPQVELTYTRTNGDDFNYQNRNYKMEDSNSFVSRLGFALGYKAPNNRGCIYTRLGWLHEFAGEKNLVVSNDILARTSTTAASKNWIEWAIGGQIKTSKATYFYADIEKTFNADINEKYRLNVGMRYSF